jgi:hypothetical protein
MSWKVESWGGQDRYPRRLRFIGSEDLAREKFAEIREWMRQGYVELVDEDGKIVERVWAPRLRTRW